MNEIVAAILLTGGIGMVFGALLYGVAKRFAVEEDERIGTVEALLPGANCGGCGYSGCKDFAAKALDEEAFKTMMCPVGGSDVMGKIAAALGRQAGKTERRVAIVACKGSCANRERKLTYDGWATCASLAALAGAQTDCTFGCLGEGDCVSVCEYDAIGMDGETGLPVVDEDRCKGCGKCKKACPKGIIAIRKLSEKVYYVGCRNEDKGAVARKACAAACIGCGKCVKNCEAQAISLMNNLATIDETKCVECGVCREGCPTKAIEVIDRSENATEEAV